MAETPEQNASERIWMIGNWPKAIFAIHPSTLPETGYVRKDIADAAVVRAVNAHAALVEALQNVAFLAGRISPPPYGHKCMWCSDCVAKAKQDARAALELAKGEK